MSPRSLPIALLATVAIIVSACGGNNGSPGTGGSGGTGATPGGTSGAGASSGTASAAPIAISGDLKIGGKLGCKPAPCKPAEGAEGAADEIAYTRYNLFADKYPDVKLTFTEADFDPKTFLTAVAAGDTPDVVRISRDILGTYIAEGALESLDSCISSHGIDMSQYREPAVAQVTSGGSVYGIPEFYDSRIILINDSVIKEVGLTPEDINTTDWTKLAQINDQLLKKDGNKISRIGFDPKLPEFLPLWAFANGAKIVSDDGLTSQLDDPKVAEALEFAVSLIKAHGSASSFFDFRGSGPGSAFFGPENQFTEDSLGAFPMEQWYLNVLANDTPDEVIDFQPFKDRQGNNISYSGGGALAIPTTAKNKEAACEFIKTITLPDTWFAAAKVRADKRKADGEAFTGVYSGNKLADEKIFGELVNEESAGAFLPGVQLVLDVSDSAYALPPIPGAGEFDRIWRAAVEDVMNNGTPAADALADADQEAQDAIDSAAQ
jgi:multiple sugar transport system substrate-binding protein